MTLQIRAIAVCATLNRAYSLENSILAREIEQQPRIPESLLWLQYQSHEPGALDTVARRMIQRQGHTLGSRTMREIGPCESYTPKQSLEIWAALPAYCKKRYPNDEAWRLEILNERSPGGSLILRDREQLDALLERAMKLPPELRDPSCISVEGYAWLSEMYRIRREQRLVAPLTMDDPIAAATLAILTPKALNTLCENAAREHLARHLAILCNSPDSVLTGPWYWADLFPALLAEMDQWAADVLGSIATTSVYKIAMDSFKFAYERKKTIRLHGQTRFGKTIVAKAFCRAFPGRARYVQVPWSNRDRHLIEEIGKAFGIRETGPKAEETIETLCQTFKVLIVLDEAHGLFPAKFSRNASPGRLNWVRLELFKRDVPVALITTPQYNDVEVRFRAATDWNIDQFNGCFFRYPELPDKITFEEMVAIGRTYLPGIDSDIVEFIAAEAQKTGKYLIYFEAIAENASWLAQRAGRAEITVDDVQAARVISTPPVAPAAPRPDEARRKSTRKPKESGAVILRPPAGSDLLRRQTEPDPLPSPTRETSPLITV